MDDMVMLNDNNNTKNDSSSDNNTNESRGVPNCFSESHLDKLRDEEDNDEVPDLASSSSSTTRTGLKVLFLSSDTGGGHRASAESLGKQFQLLFPGSTYELLDMVEKDGGPPKSSIVSAYKHLSNRPSQWKLVYHVSNLKAFEVLADAHLKLMWERSVRRRIQLINPDVVVSVHPMMTNVPVLSCQKISAETGRHLPMFTVVTDLGSAHCLWFANGVEKMFVGSETIKELAKARGKVPEEKLVLSGLPIRHDFAVQAENLGDRYSVEGKAYQRQIRHELNLPPLQNLDEPSSTPGNNVDRATILIMGGGEGVGSLENITDALYVELASQGIDALVLVVCGRNEKLKTWIEKRDWDDVYRRWNAVRNRGMIASRVLSMSLADTCRGHIRRASFPNPVIPNGCMESPADVTERIRAMISMGTNAMSAPFTNTMKSFSHGHLSNLNNEIDPNITKTDSGGDNSIIADRGESDNNNIIVTDVLQEDDEKKVSEADTDAFHNNIETATTELLQQQESSSFHLDNPFTDSETKLGNVQVQGLGFVTQMAEYMVAADILITKAGPGTISEAAAVSLPVMLTSFLPGQEEGNVDFVIKAGFGGYCDVSDPFMIAEEVCMWLQDEEKMETMSRNAKAYGKPYAARDIAKSIGESTLRWKEHNQEVTAERRRKNNNTATASNNNKSKNKPISSSLSVDDVVVLSTTSNNNETTTR